MIIHCYVATYFLISNCLKMLNVIISCYVYFLAATIRIIWSENNFSSNSWFAKFFHQITNILVIVGLLLKISSNYTHHRSYLYVVKVYVLTEHLVYTSAWIIAEYWNVICFATIIAFIIYLLICFKQFHIRK